MTSLVINVKLFSFQNYITDFFFGMVFLFFVDAMLHYILVHELIEVILLSKFQSSLQHKLSFLFAEYLILGDPWIW